MMYLFLKAGLSLKKLMSHCVCTNLGAIVDAVRGGSRVVHITPNKITHCCKD